MRRVALCALLLVAGACGPKVRPGLQATISVRPGIPAGEEAPPRNILRRGLRSARPGDDGPRITVAFDRPVARPEQVGHELARAPLSVTPPVPGKLSWTDQRTLVLRPVAPLPRSTRFEVSIPAGTAALDGTGFTKTFTDTFETERLTVALSRAGRREYARERWATPDQEVRLFFNQPVLTANVEERCAYTSASHRIEGHVKADGKRPLSARAFVMQPARPLALATRWRVVCDERLTGTEGPLPMQPIAPDASAASRPELALETYGPMKLVAVEPHGQEVDPDRSAIVVRFSNPLAGDAKSVPITIQPTPEGSLDGASLNDNEWRFSARGLAPNTEYRVSAPAGIKDEFGQATTEPLAASFRTIEPSPRFDLTTGSWVVEAARGSYVLWARNLTRLVVSAAAVSEAELPGLLPQLNWWDDESVDLAKLKTSKQLTLDATGPRNRWHQVQLDPKRFFGPRRATGFFYFAVSSPEEPLPKNSESPRVREALIDVTNLGVTAKLAAGSGLVWVTRLDSGAPVPGAEVAIRDRAGKIKWKGRTGADGMVETPGRAKLQPPAPARPEPAEEEDEGEGEGEGEGMGEGPSRGLLVFARLGSDVTFVDPERGGAFEAWNFGASPDRSGHLESLRGFAHTDRGLYRPGDTVHLRGLVRSMRLGQGLRVPTGKRAVTVEVRDPRGGTLWRKRAALSRYGSWSLDVRLPGEARLGDYGILANLPEGTFREHFSVEEYRAATFEAKVASLAPRYVVGEELRVKVESRYLYGAPLRGGKVTWRLYHRERGADFAGHPGYSFSDDLQGSELAYATPTEDLLSEKEDKLDGSGRNELHLRLPRGALPGDRELTVAAQVEDDTHQSVTATAVVPVHPAHVAFGVAASGPLMTAGKPSRVKVIAVDPSGKRIEGRARVVFRKIEWSCVWEEFGYRGSYRCDKKESDVLTRALVVPAAEPGDLTLEPPAAGEYALVIEGKDGQGNPTRTSRFFWVAGPGESPWQVDDSGRFGIVADKPRYQPGDVARLLLRTSLSGATALVTIEREGVLERRMVTLPPAGEALEVPIRDAYAPNVYVSVLLVRGRTGKGARGMPFVRMGLVNLPVESGHKRLKVEVSTDQASYRPGGKVTAQVRLTDADGKPVRGEVALAAADEGVLSLIAFKTPDPIATFYAPWGLGVRTSTQYDRLARLPEPGQERYATGGDGAGRLGTLRSRFLATAYWNPRVETDAEGRASVTFSAPDNLTAYRVMAVAADAVDRFGSGDVRFTVRKPLQLIAAMPRFLSVGDQVRGGVMLVNDTGQAGSASVHASVDGAKLTDARQTVKLAAGGRALVVFPVEADTPGEARFRFTAELGDEKDGLQWKLPVRYPTSPETQLLGQGQTTTSAAIPLALPAGLLPGSATLDVSVDPDGLAGIEEGLRALIEYPYGCLEQTTSRLIPLVAVEELARTLGLAELDGPKLQRFIGVALDKLAGFQTDSGGFGLWRGSPPEPYLTAFALWGYKLAADAGHAVDKKRMAEGVKYLRRSLGQDLRTGGIHDELGELGSRAFALYVLNLLGQPEPGFGERLLEQKDKLPRFGLAFLAQALAGSLGREHERVAGILDELGHGIEQDAKGALAVLRELPDPHLGFYMSSDTRTSAIATDAYLYLRPAAPEIPKLVQGLLAQRRRGEWDNTQENLYALVALTHYLKERPAPPTAAKVTLGERSLLDGALPTSGTARIRHLGLALPGGPPPALTVAATQGTVHYQARLRFRCDRAHQPAVEQGFKLQREILDPATGTPVSSAKAGAMVKIKVTLATSAERSHVAVSDWLPAGFEPVNARFATSTPVPAERPREWSDDGYEMGSIQQRELRDDRVDVFYEWLPPGQTSFEYYVRATTAGSYAIPAATVEEMYHPEVRGRTEMGTFSVTEK